MRADWGVLIDQKQKNLRWDSADLCWSRIERDWHQNPLDVAAAFALATDPAYLWFAAARDKPASISPDAHAQGYVAGLWQYDVAELFIRDADSDHYLEFNLAPNGAWWSAGFISPRVRACGEQTPIPGVKTNSRISDNGHWQAAAAIPLSYLQSHFGFGPRSRVNVTFIVDTPDQKFLSHAALPGAVPDFHQPDHFEGLEFTS